MELKRKLYSGAAEALAENRQVVVIISTDDVDRQGDIVVQAGILLDAYRANPVVLWQHDPMHPIARCAEIGIADGKLRALVQFPPEGTSEKADEVYGLIRAGVVNAASIGFLPLDAEPMDEKQPWAGQRFLSCELMEFSFVSVPANRGATVVGRAAAQDETEEVAPQVSADASPPPAPKPTRKGLYEVGWLASLLESLGCLEDSVAFEAAVEEDESQVPAMLHDALQRLGAALVAMTAEEVAELLAGDDDDDAPDDGGDIVMRARIDYLRLGLKLEPGAVLAWAAMLREQAKGASFVVATGPDVVKQVFSICRAGKVLSSANQKLLKEAMAHHASMAEQHKAMGDCVKAVLDTADNSVDSEEADEGQGEVSGQTDTEKAAFRRRVTVLRLQGAA